MVKCCDQKITDEGHVVISRSRKNQSLRLKL